MTNENIDLPSIRKWTLNVFRGSAVFIYPNGDVRGDLDGTKISVISTEGWEQLDYDHNLTVKDIIPNYVIQEIDVCELLNSYMKSIGVVKFLEQFPDPHKKDVS